MSTDAVKDRAWLHHCGTLNRGQWEGAQVCSGCQFVTRPSEIIRYWLFPDSDAADDVTPATPLLEPDGTVFEVTDVPGNSHKYGDVTAPGIEPINYRNRGG